MNDIWCQGYYHLLLWLRSFISQNGLYLILGVNSKQSAYLISFPSSISTYTQEYCIPQIIQLTSCLFQIRSPNGFSVLSKVDSNPWCWVVQCQKCFFAIFFLSLPEIKLQCVELYCQYICAVRNLFQTIKPSAISMYVVYDWLFQDISFPSKNQEKKMFLTLQFWGSAR